MILIAKRSHLKDVLETVNHHEGLLKVQEYVKAGVRISEHVIQDLHELILHGIERENARRYRNVQVFVGNHMPPRSEVVPMKMDELLYWYEDLSKDNSIHPILKAAQFHHRLEGSFTH